MICLKNSMPDNVDSMSALALTRILNEALGLRERKIEFNDDTPLLGALPELDSMTIAAVVMAMEEEIGRPIEEDDISAEIFESFGGLRRFFESQLAAHESTHQSGR